MQRTPGISIGLAKVQSCWQWTPPASACCGTCLHQHIACSALLMTRYTTYHALQQALAAVCVCIHTFCTCPAHSQTQSGHATVFKVVICVQSCHLYPTLSFVCVGCHLCCGYDSQHWFSLMLLVLPHLRGCQQTQAVALSSAMSRCHICAQH